MSEQWGGSSNPYSSPSGQQQHGGTQQYGQQNPYDPAFGGAQYAPPQQFVPGAPVRPADHSRLQTNAIVLIVVGALCGAMLPAVFGIIALAQLNSDPASSRTMIKVGWIVFIVCAVLLTIFIIGPLILQILFMILAVGAVSMG